jgi:N-acetylglucosaminyl-diphospho-decaprenol L-rhamnosyltransferase
MLSQTPHSPTVTVVVVNWNVSALLRECLRSIDAQRRRPASDYEVIVVDNASSDDSVRMVRRDFPWVKVVENADNVGFGRANNQAYAMARGQHVLLLNPDTVVLDGALDRMISYLERHPDVGALGCRLLNSDGSYQRWTAGAFPTIGRTAKHAFLLDLLFPASLGARSLYLNRDVQEDLDVDWVTGACMALRREAVGDHIFDDTFFMYGEDTELCDRLHRSGWRVVYSPTATVVHHHGKSMAQQSGAILLTAFKGPRAFYIRRHSRASVWLYDLLLAAGFALRWLCYLALSLVPAKRAVFRMRAASSRSYMTRALRVMVGQ